MVLRTKVKNAVSKKLNCEFRLENTTINGTKRGCWGWIRNKDNDRIVYVDTEPSVLGGCDFLHRYAKDFKE